MRHIYEGQVKQWVNLFFILLLYHLVNTRGCNFGGSADCVFPCGCKEGVCNELTGGCATSEECKAQMFGIGKFWSGFGCLTGIISFKKNTNQSDGEQNGFKAVDESKKTCTQPKVGAGATSAWWSVNLENLYFINSVTVLSPELGKLQNIEVRISNSTISPVSSDFESCATTPAATSQSGEVEFNCNSPVIGSTVTLYNTGGTGLDFTICQVDVIGHRYVDCAGCNKHCNEEYGCVDICPARKNQTTLCSTDCTLGFPCPGSCAHCLDNTTCTSSTGKCPSGCQRWWTTEYCNMRIEKIDFGKQDLIAIYNVTSVSFNMKWKQLYSNTEEILLDHYGYLVQYKNNSATWTERNVLSNTSFINISGLHHNTPYEYRVRPYRIHAIVEYGDTPNSNMVKTKCIEPDPPDDVWINILIPENGTQLWTINVTWQLPSETGCDSISSTQVKYHHMSDHHPARISHTRGSFLLFRLDTPGTYLVEIILYNDKNITSKPIVRNMTIDGDDGIFADHTDSGYWLLIIIVTCAVGVGLVFVMVVLVVVLQCRSIDKCQEDLTVNTNEPTAKARNIDEQNSTNNDSTVISTPISQTGLLHDMALIPVEQFEAYFTECRKHENTLREKFHKIPKEGLSSCTYAIRRNNLLKNRYKNIIPYDHNRVHLTEINGQPDSDYINASFITGYPEDQYRYVAAQGPKAETIEDFWRMISIYKITCIVMLTSCAEETTKLCDIYWPENVGDTEVYGTAVVKLETEVITAHYSVRDISLEYQGELLNLRHYQMTSWRDKTKPDSPLPMMSLVNIVRDMHSNDKGPTLIHCSAGVGRTGTYIAIEYLLDQAGVEGCVDVDGLLCRMRAERPCMVQTLNQYTFIHEVLIHYFRLGQTLIPVSQLITSSGYDDAMLKCTFQDLASLKSTESASKVGMLPENANKNRKSSVIPDDKFRPLLYQPNECGSDYINAVFCDSFWRTDNVILSQLPLKNTIEDFWMMVFDHNVGTILLLDNLARLEEQPFWPDECKHVFGPLVVEGLHKMTDPSLENLIVWDITVALSMKPQEMISVTLYQYLGWTSCETISPNLVDILKLINIVEQPLMSSRRTIIQCLDGVSHSSLFVAACHVVTQAIVWEEVDIPLTILALRERRSSSITLIEQFTFLNDLVQVHLSADKRASVCSMRMFSSTLSRSKTLHRNVTKSTNDVAEPVYGNTPVMSSAPINDTSEYMTMTASLNRLNTTNRTVCLNYGHSEQTCDPIYANVIAESAC